MCCKRYHIIFSTSSLKFKCKACVEKEVIIILKITFWSRDQGGTYSFKETGAGMQNQITIILFKIWPTNSFSKAKSYSFHFHENYVTWPLRAKGLFWSWGNLVPRLSFLPFPPLERVGERHGKKMEPWNETETSIKWDQQGVVNTGLVLTSGKTITKCPTFCTTLVTATLPSLRLLGETWRTPE